MSTDSPTGNLTGHTVLDDHHEKVGTVSDVLYDDRGEASWAVVDQGPLRAAKFVPVAGSFMTEGGDVVIPYGKEQVKQGPKAGRDHVLGTDMEMVLQQHYQLT